MSPMLFMIYIKLLSDAIRRCRLWPHQYADDSQHCLALPSNPKVAMEIVNQDLEEVMEWMRSNKLKLHADKTELLLLEANSVLGTGISTVPLKAYIHIWRVLLSQMVPVTKRVYYLLPVVQPGTLPQLLIL